jgi:hypothetical protein
MIRTRALGFAFAALAFLALGPERAAGLGPAARTDAWVSGFRGAWAAPKNMTPMGPIPFALVFDAETDGSLHAHTALSSETWVDLRFHRDTERGWLLTEGGSLQGLGEQWHTLRPAEASGDTLDWVDVEHPEFLRCRMAADARSMYLLVLLRGKEHARFALGHLEGDAEKQLRASLEAARTRPAVGDMAKLRSAAVHEDSTVKKP